MRVSSASRPTRNPNRGSVLGVLLFIFVSVVIVSVGTAFYIANNVRVQTTHRHGGDDFSDFSIATPAGKVSIRAHEDPDPATIGLPVYPGATRQKNSGVASFEWASADGKADRSVAFAAAELLTQDSPLNVLAWYRTQLPNWLVVTDRDGAVRFELREGGHKRIVGIRGKNDGTHIGIAAMGDPASN
jgi:hypothetical protein